MCDAERAPPSCRVIERLLHLSLRLAIEGRRGLVQHEHTRLSQQGPRDTEALLLACLGVGVGFGFGFGSGFGLGRGLGLEPLLLTAAQPQPSLTHHRLQTRLKTVHVAVHPR